jgi:hypothetical protein
MEFSSAMLSLLKFSSAILLTIAGSYWGEALLPLPAALKPSMQLTAQTQTITLPVALPTEALIVLKNGKQQIGQIMTINAQRRELKLQGMDDQHSIAINSIESVRFSNNALAYQSNGRPILRGNRGQPSGKPVIWNPLPLNALRIKDPGRGRGEVILGASVSSVNRSGSPLYVIDEIQFDTRKGTMTIKATPY